MVITGNLSDPSTQLIILSGVFCYLASVAVYRLFLDPLAKFPGPKLAVLTRYYEAYYDVVQNGQYTYKIDKLHKQYGPIIRISPYELHVKDPAFFGHLYRQDRNWIKYEWMQRAFAAGARSTFNTIPHDLHRVRRAPLDMFFSKINVAKRQEIILACVNKFCRRFTKAAAEGMEIDLGDALAATGTDIATHYILGKSFNNLDREDFNSPMTNMIRSHGGVWRTTKHVTFLGPILLALPLNVLEKLSGEDTREFVAFLRYNKARTEAEMAEISASGPEDNSPVTMVQAILKSKSLPPSEKDFDRIHSEVDTVTGAGIETLGQTLRLTCFHIFENRKILERLRNELAEVSKFLGPNAAPLEGKMVLPQLERLPHLTAVVKEGLRMSPGLATRLARIAPDRELQYGSYRIPAGTPVGMTVLLMHYDEKQYPNPETFNPERWLSSDSGKQGEKIFAPFSRGTRMCIGMHLAYAELYAIIATLVTNFDIEFVGAKAEDVKPNHDSFVIGPNARLFLVDKA